MFLDKPLSPYWAPTAGCSTLLVHRSAWRIRTARQSLPSFVIQNSPASLERHLVPTQKAGLYRSPSNSVPPAYLPQSTKLPFAWMLQSCISCQLHSHPQNVWIRILYQHQMKHLEASSLAHKIPCKCSVSELSCTIKLICFQRLIPISSSQMFICDKPSLGNFFQLVSSPAIASLTSVEYGRKLQSK